MPSNKVHCRIATADVPRVFDDACIKRLAAIAKLPPDADVTRFAAGVRDAARTYPRDASTPTAGEVRDEIAALYKVAEGWQYERAASLRAKLSPQAQAYLKARLSRPGPRAAGLKLPTAKALRDPKRQEDACEMLARICRVGGRYIEDRKRPLLHAPVPDKHPAKREAERRFVMNLQLAWLEATGEKPALTARRGVLGPFARLACECLKLVGASHADVVWLINELQRRRKAVRRQLPRKWPKPRRRTLVAERALSNPKS
jgi:hypothetical protein